MSDGMSTLAERLVRAQFDLYAFISVMMGGASEAADVLQETNLAVLKDESSYDPSRPFMFWVRGVARNRIQRFYRARSRDKLIFDEDLMDSLAEQMPCATDDHPLEELGQLEHCMERLVPKQREMITARYMRGEAVKSIAARENSSEGAVSVLLYRIRRLLANCIERDRKRMGEFA